MRANKNKHYLELLNERYHLKNVGIWDSFLSFFDFENKRYSEFENYITSRSDFEIDRSDWNIIANDFRTVISENVIFDLNLSNKDEEVKKTQNTNTCVK